MPGLKCLILAASVAMILAAHPAAAQLPDVIRIACAGVDDTRAINAAFAALIPTGGTVEIRPGTCVVNQGRLVYRSIKPITLRGAGWASKIVWKPASDTPPQDKGLINFSGVGPAADDHLGQAVIRDLAIDCGGSRQASYDGNKRCVNIYNADNVSILDSQIKGAIGEAIGIGNFGSPATPGTGALVQGNEIVDFGQVGINPNNFSSRIIGNRIHRGVVGIEAGRSRLVIVGNELSDLTSHGIAVSSVAGFVVANNLLRNTMTFNPGSVRGAILVVGGGSNEPSSVGVIDANVIIEERRHPNQVGIALERGTATQTNSHIKMSNNVIDGTQQGIFTDDLTQSTISGNLIGGHRDHGSSTGIELLASPHVTRNVVSGNVLVGPWTNRAIEDQNPGGQGNRVHSNDVH